ncbi:family 10 glycosylhydrolase [Kamptonema sp. UHCC 0994]|uniref:family 10 glycosylhydrolase n=1 Tax=Kamptonema sp. UHCC 0994 TaxID=3031329 RepID=UPI0023B91D0C|nr:family 10 glycosylhydrolase [Kamptonema sp. UHCC 0994]MDF0555194.1 family 10 glycosylhydrolase [Kamptonema sp. UHCC 0994]
MQLKKPHIMPDIRLQARKTRLLVSVLVGTLASSLVNLLVLLPSPGLTESVLGVVRSSDNSADWIKITTRLWESGIGRYKPINLEDIKSATDLAGVSVLFLPNIETLSAVQVKAIEEWMKQGGRLIATGPVGRSSPALVRQSLRSLLGAYWAFPLTQATTPEPRIRCRDIACKVSTNWVPPEQANATVKGGVLIPADMNSQTAAIWKQSDGSSAVVASDRATYLGWRWGTDGSPELDRIWMQASLTRWGGTVGPAPDVARSGQGSGDSRGGAPVPAPEQGRISRSTPVNPSPPSTLLPPSPPSPPSFPSSPSGPVPENFTDPSEQSAPAGLDVEASANKPISTIEAYLMRQELTNLLGRFESSLIAANSANVAINLNAASFAPQLVAATNNIGGGVATRPPVIQGAAAGAIAQAKQVLQEFDRLIAAQNYSAARQQWLQARQQLWRNYPTEGQRVGAEIRAVWLDRGSIVKAGSEQGLAAIFDRLAQAGINTVFFETLNAGYPIYPSQVAPQQNPLTVGWDPMEAAVKLAHERGMELHAWIWTFATGNKRHNTLLGLSGDYPGPVLSAHPDWANIDNQGRRQHVNDGKFYLDPANKEARSYLLQIIGEISSKYKVDGLQLDYIRYPFQDPNLGFSYGYGKAAREQFQQSYGVDPVKLSPDSGDLWRKWTEFKTEQINSFVAEVSQFLRQNYPRTIISVAVFPHPESQRIYKIQQNWEVWARRGDVDLIVPMTYALDTNRLQRIAQPLAREQNLGTTLIAPAVKLLQLPEIVAIDQIQALRDLPTGGYSIFAVETISNNLQSFFSRTQGQTPVRSQSANGPIPYRQPFEAAAVRYTALKQEWSLLLATNQLRISNSELNGLRSQSDELAQALSALAANPSADKLGNARRLLEAFESQFQNSMRLHSMENGYQVQTWQNRLASLEMLLRYGERVELNRR